MIHVCSLARLHATLEATHAQHVVTLLKQIELIARPLPIPTGNHLHVGVDDIAEPIDGYIHPADEHVARLIDFVQQWERTAPLVVHCYAGISRSTAAAFITACALRPERDEASIATAIRNASPTASPNPLLVALADRRLGRRGRMIAAVQQIGPCVMASEGVPFRLDLE
ncbi:MAG: protein tyrosine phosphatase [Rhizobiales bacterium]|nr:protein tyrosine phosphatase [Hyphomicrobiales bacterium]